MDSWPVDERKRTSNESTKKKGKRKANEEQSRIPYPELELGGNFLSLVEKDNRLDWTSAAQLRQEYKPLNVYKSGTLFPATKPPSIVEAHPSVRHKAEQGANFLRTFQPEVDISSELIRDQLSEDSQFKRNLEQFDPDLQNLLNFLPVYSDQDPELYGYLAFPMGELGRELNLSRIVDKDDAGILAFEPYSLPLKTYQTPMRHIVTRKAPINNGGHFLAVRTFGQLHIEKLQHGRTHGAMPSLTEVLAITHYQTGNKGLADFEFGPSGHTAFTVNELGALYQIEFSAGQSPFAVRPLAEGVNAQETDGFWRVSPLQDGNLVLRLSTRRLEQVDSRSKDIVELFSIPPTREVFTSIDNNGEDGLLRLCSTREIFWLDARSPGRPMLSYKHGREYDRTLEVLTTPWTPTLTLLTSRRNQLMTIYDVSRSEAGTVHLNSLPSLLSIGHYSLSQNLGRILVPHNEHYTSASFISLSDRGALQHIDIGPSDRMDICVMEARWSTRVKALEKHPPKPKPLPYEEREYSEANLSNAYDRLFNQWFSEREQREEQGAEALYELVENFPLRLQQSDTPLDHVLTTYDAILRSGEDPTKPARADFFTDNPINSTRGFRAVDQGRLSAESLGKVATWHHSLLPTLQKFDPDATDDLSTRLRSLQRYNLAEDDGRSFSSMNNEKIANEQLALDLTLSTHVFSMQAFSKQTQDDDSGLENMTQTLSLGAEPPPVRFSYFRPIRNNIDGTPIDDFGSPGVRAMLNNWQLGTDPDEAISIERRDQRPQSPIGERESMTRQQERAIPGTQPTRPPVIVASQPTKPPTILPAIQSQELFVGSQKMFGQETQSQSQPSQEFASTQILPGAHGGRPHQAKKKIAKKRIGGF